MNLEGDLRSVSLSKVLLAISGQDGQGILTVQGEDDIVAVSFKRGEIVTADALNETVEEGLGRVLQSRGLVDPEQFRGVAAEHQGGSAGSLADLLVQRGLVERKPLLDALRIQTFRQMFKILAWRQGEYKFYSGDEVSYEEGFQEISVEELLVRAIDKLGEKVGMLGPLPDIEAIYRQVPPRGQVQVLGRDGDGGVGIWINQEQADFLAQIDGNRRATEIAQDLSLGKFKAAFAVYHLLQYDLIENAGRGGAANASPFAEPLGPGTTVQVPRPDLDASSTGGAAASAPVFADEVPTVQPLPEPRKPPPRPRRERPTVAQVVDQSPAADRSFDEALDMDLDATGMRLPSPPKGRRPVPFRGPDESLPAPSGLVQWIGPGLALVLLAGVVLNLVGRPAGLMLPFPWQENQRSTLERQIRESLYRRVDRAAKTYFLMEGQFPGSLQQLVDRGLISPSDLEDPAGFELVYSHDETSYHLQLRDGGEIVEGLGTTEAITGDFFVDSQFLSTAAEPPLVLLD